MPRRRCRKRTYYTELRAMIALIEVQKRRGSGKAEQSVYRCPPLPKLASDQPGTETHPAIKPTKGWPRLHTLEAGPAHTQTKEEP